RARPREAHRRASPRTAWHRQQSGNGSDLHNSPAVDLRGPRLTKLIK
ncbi:MAG: hypothetical protein J2P54_00580, partial [Bradyrhizobiaceae bacterium]|nr:hypothetical protein [Bradyrhizobiaceae bacterium]